MNSTITIVQNTW